LRGIAPFNVYGFIASCRLQKPVGLFAQKTAAATLWVLPVSGFPQPVEFKRIIEKTSEV